LTSIKRSGPLAPQDRLDIGKVEPAVTESSRALNDSIDWDRFTHWPAERDGVRVAESSLRIGGMHCAACATTIEQALSRVDGVVDARVSAAAQYALVRWDPTRTRASALANAVTTLGYDAVPDTATGARALRQREARVALWRLFVAALCAMQVMMLATPSYVSAPGELSRDLAQLLAWGSWLLTLPVMVFSAAPFFIGAWRSISQRRIGMDVPVALGIAVAFVASSGAAFDPAGMFGHEVYFDSLTMFIAFLLGGRYLEMRARHRAAISLENTLGSLPQTVMRVAADGSVESVSAQQLLRGDIVRVPVGQAFAADGILTQGRTQADESLLSGESIPLTKDVGDPVIAGSTNLLAPVLMRVERLGADTRYEAIVALMRRAQTQRPASVAAADRWATPVLWAVLLLAGGAAAFWNVIDPARAVWVAVSVLIVTCPCALSLAAPSSMLAATSAMARRGVLLRRLQAIEGLTRMQTLFIDKTGTLTEATLRSIQLQCVNADCTCSDADLRRIAASLGGWSTHPLARMLAASTERATIEWRDVVEVAGRGMQGTASDGAVWRLGAASWAGTTGLADIDSNAASWLSRDGVCVARFSIEDSLRADAAQAVRALQADGVRIALISGDDPRRVDRIGRSLGVDDCAGGLSPEGKLSVLRAAQQRGEIVAMVGDGINDAPVLAQADVSLAMGEGALVARTQADGVLMSNKLDDLVRARALARKTLRVVRQNIAWALHGGQFDDLEQHGEQILDADNGAFDRHQDR